MSRTNLDQVSLGQLLDRLTVLLREQLYKAGFTGTGGRAMNGQLDNVARDSTASSGEVKGHLNRFSNGAFQVVTNTNVCRRCRKAAHQAEMGQTKPQNAGRLIVAVSHPALHFVVLVLGVDDKVRIAKQLLVNGSALRGQKGCGRYSSIGQGRNRQGKRLWRDAQRRAGVIGVWISGRERRAAAAAVRGGLGYVQGNSLKKIV